MPGQEESEDRLRALGDELLRIGRRASTTYPGALLDNSAFRILWQLAEHGVRTQRELAETLQLEQSTISRQVNAAIRHGLVVQQSVPGSTLRPLRATDAGSAAYAHDGALRAARIDGALATLGDDDAARLVDLLRRFNDALDAAQEAADAQR